MRKLLFRWEFVDRGLNTSEFDLHRLVLRLLQLQLLSERVDQRKSMVGGGDDLNVKIAQGLLHYSSAWLHKLVVRRVTDIICAKIRYQVDAL